MTRNEKIEFYRTLTNIFDYHIFFVLSLYFILCIKTLHYMSSRIIIALYFFKMISERTWYNMIFSLVPWRKKEDLIESDYSVDILRKWKVFIGVFWISVYWWWKDFMWFLKHDPPIFIHHDTTNRKNVERPSTIPIDLIINIKRVPQKLSIVLSRVRKRTVMTA